MPAPNPWRLTYPGTDLSFGGLDDVATFGEAPDLGSLDIANDDSDLPRSDGRAFGTDYFGGRTITFPSLLIRGADEQEARSKAGMLTGAWRADAVRSTPGAVATLTIPSSAGSRYAFGRPRRFSRNDEGRLSGLIEAQADFVCSSPDFFGSEVSQTVNFATALGGGLSSPLKAPLTTIVGADRKTTFTVSTDLPVWPRVQIHGPVINPEVIALGAFRFSILGSVAYDEDVIIDTAPWARSTLRTNGSIAAISRTSTRLSRAAVPAGSYDLTLRGQDQTGSSWARVSWRPRFASI